MPIKVIQVNDKALRIVWVDSGTIKDLQGFSGGLY